MPLLLSNELWLKTKRWQSAGDELYRLKDRQDKDYLLAPTHEEIFTSIIANESISHNGNIGFVNTLSDLNNKDFEIIYNKIVREIL